MSASPAPAELVSAISELKDEFQHVADLHPWVCLGIPLGDVPMPFAVVGAPVTYFTETYPGIYGVITPGDPVRRAVVAHVGSLTGQAVHLLSRAIDHARIDHDIREAVREGERLMIEGGWVRWLRRFTIFQPRTRIEHYAQVAATALVALRERCRGEGPAAPAAEGRRSIRIDGANWVIHFGGERGTYPVNDFSALEGISMLVARPGHKLGLTELMGADPRALAEDAKSGAPVLDNATKDQLNKEYAELQLDKARNAHDPLVLGEIERDMNNILAQLRTAQGLGNRVKPLGVTATGRAWGTLTRGFRRLWDRLQEGMPNLVAHLKSSLDTDCPYVTYNPPAGSQRWETDEPAVG